MLPLQKFDNILIRMVIGKSTEEYRGGARNAGIQKMSRGGRGERACISQGI